MIIDSSALLCILKGEPERDRMTAAIAKADGCSSPAPTILEASIVIEGQAGESGRIEQGGAFAKTDISVAQY